MLVLEPSDKFYTTREQKAFYEAMKTRKVFERYVDLFSLAAAIGIRKNERVHLEGGREELFNAPTMPGDMQFAFSILLGQRHEVSEGFRANILLSEYAAAGVQYLIDRWRDSTTLRILRDVYDLAEEPSSLSDKTLAR